jgi:hypothetical protein
MFGSCRIPGEHVDQLVTFNDRKHCVIMRFVSYSHSDHLENGLLSSKGVYYRMEMYAKDKRGRMTRLNKPEIMKQLEYIKEQTASKCAMPHVRSSMTTSVRCSRNQQSGCTHFAKQNIVGQGLIVFQPHCAEVVNYFVHSKELN